jgi:hypothetical protein
MFHARVTGSNARLTHLLMGEAFFVVIEDWFFFKMTIVHDLMNEPPEQHQ